MVPETREDCSAARSSRAVAYLNYVTIIVHRTAKSGNGNNEMEGME